MIQQNPNRKPALLLVLVTALWCLGAAEVPIQTKLSLDLAHPGAAISPYIYGQFIEHLGRCIHDGIWAEKLRDRKFLLALDKSPWQTVRAPESRFEAHLDSAGAYAGEHCLALWRRDSGGGACGVMQKDIGVIAGKVCTGYVIAAGLTDGAELEAALKWGDAAGDEEAVRITGLSQNYKRVPFLFKPKKTTETASFALRLKKPGLVWIGCASLMPGDNVRGMRADVLELIKQLDTPITRWPGGNFVSGYHWKDGIGERDRRPPRWERAWNDVEDNDFGLDEFMAFCAEVKTEPYIAVNTGLGGVLEAADEVEYATGAAGKRWGAERARNGHPPPYAVNWWGIGNEMYGGWQLGNVPVERYALRHNAFVRAMKESNPRIRIIGVGAPGPWNDAFLPVSAAHLDLLSGHHYAQRHFRAPFSQADAAKYEENFLAYSDSVSEGIRKLLNDYRQRLGKGSPELDRVRLAIDEWGIVRDWNSAPDPPGFGSFEHYYPLGDGLAAARGLHEILRAADLVSMANWAQTVNVIGAIKTSRNYAVLNSVGHLLALYRKRFGGALIPARLQAEAPLDVVAALDQKSGRLSLGLVNFSPARDVALTISVDSAKPPASKAHLWQINGPDLGALNIPGQPETVTTREMPPTSLAEALHLRARSITVVTAQLKR